MTSVPLAKQLAVSVKKAEASLQTVWGEVYIPDVLDTQGDFCTAEDIRKMAWEFLASGMTRNVDVGHNNELSGAVIVESFIARKDDPTFIEGSWVVGVHIPDADLWAKVEKNEINGFSLQAMVEVEHVDLEIEVPEQISGRTQKTDGHDHTYCVSLGSDGQIVGGEAGGGDHVHKISKSNVTGPGPDGHVHRFNFVDDLHAAA